MKKPAAAARNFFGAANLAARSNATPCREPREYKTSTRGNNRAALAQLSAPGQTPITVTTPCGLTIRFHARGRM